jgi:hypothetical protein
VEILDAYTVALRQQLERAAWEAGELAESELRSWRPGQVIRNRLRIEAGHAVGKTKLASGIVNHFYDCFAPAIVYTFAPTWEQIHDLLWKEIKADRTGRGLPGRILDVALDNGPAHFAKGRATSNVEGRGTERVQGQHGPYLMFVLDEAEGVADYVYDAVDSMTSGGLSVVLMLANPRTRTSRFHKAATLSTVWSARVSCVHHPNVVAGREVVPGAVRREYVEDMLAKHCEVVAEPNEDLNTFTLPWRPGVIYRPDAEFMFRVLGIAPANVADNVLIATGRFQAAIDREAPGYETTTVAWMGVDVARYGKDMGTLYVRHAGRVWRAAQFSKQDTVAYYTRIREEARRLAEQGVRQLVIRIDGGGGFGGGVIDQLAHDLELARMFAPLAIIEVHFNGVPYSPQAYADLVTEMYATAGEALQHLALIQPPDALEADLCERPYRWVTARGLAVKQLEPKENVHKRLGRSPDDGDGFALAAAPDYVFQTQLNAAATDVADEDDYPVSISPY